MKTFRLKKGTNKHYLSDGSFLSPGDTVKAMSILDFRGAQDKFEEYPPRVRAKKVEETEPEKEVEEKSKKDPEKPKPEESPEDISELEMKHYGGGRFGVINTDTDEKINDDWLSKEEAEALVAKYQA